MQKQTLPDFLLSQLLDDLNDRELDIQDGNHTIFTVNNCIPEIKALFYILNVKQYFDNIQSTNSNITKILAVSNHLANMFVFNSVRKQNSIVDTVKLQSQIVILKVQKF